MYLATINTPGYLPESDEPATFDTAAEAWAYLADEVKRAEDDFEGDGYSATANTLESLGSGHLHPNDAGLDFDGTGTVYGPTPGYEGDHDLGKAYSVSVYEPENVDVEVTYKFVVSVPREHDEADVAQAVMAYINSVGWALDGPVEIKEVGPSE